MTRVARIGADPTDDEELRQKKALLVVVTVIILPDLARVGRPLHRPGNVGRHHRARLLRGRARLARGVRPHAAVRALPARPAPRHPADAEPRADGMRRLACLRWGRAVGPPGSARRPRLSRAAPGDPLVRGVRRDLPGDEHRRRRAVRAGRLPQVVHQHDPGAQRRRRRLPRLHAACHVRQAARPGVHGASGRAGEVRAAASERPAAHDRRAAEGRRRADRRPLRRGLDPFRRRRGLHPARRAALAGGDGRGPRPPLLPVRRAGRAARAREDQDDRGRLHGRRGRAGSASRPRAAGGARGA